jgi:hypothetical protein
MASNALACTDIDPASVGRRVVLLYSYPGSARFIGQCFQDFMAIVRQHDRLSLFITFTANPKWGEIPRKLLPGQQLADRSDLVARVFHMKLNHLLYGLKRKHIFGRYCGSVWTIEYQKHDLPHLHLLLFLYPYDCGRLLDLAVIDRFICA